MLRESTEMLTEAFSSFSGPRAMALVIGGFTAGGVWAIRLPVSKTIKFFASRKAPYKAHSDKVFLTVSHHIYII
jgi:hypothetical protein